MSLALDPAVAVLVRGDDTPVEVTLTRAAGVGSDVTLSVSGLPALVTASFDPPTLSGAALTSTLTLSADPSAAVGTYPLSIVGSFGGAAATATLSLEVTSMTVTGQVVTYLNYPAVGVAVGSQGVASVTDDDGRFALPGLSIPYDLSVWNAAEDWVHVYEGMTAAEVTVSSLTGGPATPESRSAMVSGMLTGSAIPVGINQSVLVCPEGLDGTVIGCAIVLPTQSAYALNAEWVGSSSRKARLHALQVELGGDGYPIAYHGYTSVAVTLTDGVPATVNLDLGEPLTTTTVDVELDAAVTVGTFIAAVEVGPNMTLPVLVVGSAATEHSVRMPVIDGSSYTYVGSVDSTYFGWQAGATGSTVTISIPSRPQLVAPGDGTTGVTVLTDFTVSNMAGGPITYSWSAVGGPAVALTSLSSTRKVPDLAPYNIALPAGTTFSWEAFGHSGSSTFGAVNPIGGYYGYVLLSAGSGSHGLKGAGSLVSTAGAWQFVTAP